MDKGKRTLHTEMSVTERMSGTAKNMSFNKRLTFV